MGNLSKCLKGSGPYWEFCAAGLPAGALRKLHPLDVHYPPNHGGFH